MKNLNKKISIVALLLLLGATACSGNVSSSITSGSSTSHGDTPWSGNWEKPGVSIDSQPPLTHLCEAACYTCGKCLTDCTDPVCAEKCFELNGRTQYTFSAIDDHVEKKGGVSIEGDHIGNINVNPNAKLIYHITAAEDTVVCFGATISEMNDESHITSETPITVNGEQFYSRGYMESKSTNWTVFSTVWLGCLELKQGDNEIILENHNTSGVQYNFKDFTFLSPTELTWTPIEEHICTSKDENGKCTNYDCNEFNCLDKAVDGWNNLIIQGSDEKVLKYYIDDSGEEHSLWIENEGVIGQLANSSITGIYNQTIIFSFEATEETYVELTLNTSTVFGNTPYEEMYDLTFNGEPIVTGGVSASSTTPGWADFKESTVAFVKAKKGLNTFKMVHKPVNAGDNIKYLSLTYQNGDITIAQAEK